MSDTPDFTPPFGMTPRQTASYVAGFIEDSAERFLNASLEADKGGYLEFEGQSMEEVLDQMSGDLMDLVAHASLLHIKVCRMRKALAGEREAVQ